MQALRCATSASSRRVELDARLCGTFAGLREHRGRRLDADDRAARRAGNRNRDAPVANRRLASGDRVAANIERMRRLAEEAQAKLTAQRAAEPSA